MRSRLRQAPSPAELATWYPAPHRHDQWPDHVVRVDETIRLARELAAITGPPLVIADLSCGDAAIARCLAPEFFRHQAGRVILGDLAPGYELHGPIEVTIASLAHADMFICTETVEHLDDPDAVLRQIRAKAGSLVLSTPDDEIPGINPEHLWTWNRDDVRAMLEAAWWKPALSRTVTWKDEHGWPWSYQIWGCT